MSILILTVLKLNNTISKTQFTPHKYISKVYLFSLKEECRFSVIRSISDSGSDY